jgi:alpha-ketoglutarate-dependent 2,4-dichlorophenoxyacetate dioxygenase
MALHYEPMKPQFVAVASGIDLRQSLDRATLDELIGVLDRYGVLVFHGQPLSKEELVSLGKQFGPVDEALQKKLTQRVQDRLHNSAITDISNIDSSGKVADRKHKQSALNVGNRFWHSDSSYAHHPFRYSILAAVTAASWGGQTEYADLRAAYDALDPRTRELISDKVATFYSHFTRQWLGIDDGPEDLTAYPPVRWPMVRTHPGSGRKLIWCDSKVCEISDMTLAEGRALAHELIEHIGQSERVYSHTWRAGDVVFYDNRSVLHRGRRFDLSERREMRRVSTLDDAASLGEAPFAVTLPVAISGRTAPA